MRDELLKIWPKDGSIKSILDLGCRDCWHTAGLPGVFSHTGVEVWPAALNRGIKKALSGGLPNFQPILSEALEYLRKCSDDDVDAVLAIDLVEHLKPNDALALLDEMVRVARKLAVAWTTHGYIEQAPYDVDGEYNPHEEHKWGPTAEDFGKHGWRVRIFPRWHEARGGAILAWYEVDRK